MTGRCGICLKTTSNKKKKGSLLVTSNAEAKIQFRYYSVDQKDLNRTLFNTKVHQKCYKKYHDRRYNQFIRNTKMNNLSNNLETEVMLVNNENETCNDCVMVNSYSMNNLSDGNDDDENYDKENNDGGHYDDEDYISDNYKNHHSIAHDFLCLTTITSNQSISGNNIPVFTEISNIDHSVHSTNNNTSTNQIFPENDFSNQYINDENNGRSRNSILESDIQWQSKLFGRLEKKFSSIYIYEMKEAADL